MRPGTIKGVDYRTYHRNYNRARHNRTPRKEPMELARADFERIILAGGYGSIPAASKRVGVSRMTGWRWLRKMLFNAQSRSKLDLALQRASKYTNSQDR